MKPGNLSRALESPHTAVARCLATIREREPAIHAWSQIEVRGPVAPGPFRGVPFGVKDIYHAEGTRTEFGTPVFAGQVSKSDAWLVRRLRELGAAVLGKTHTTAFAYFDSALTRNPHNPAHTPGGSSSGSAAAVAAGMAPFALGSQTQGSVLRPASFCGVAGFKPTVGLIPLEGVMPFAPTLDTAGFFTGTAADMALLWRLMGNPAGAAESPRLCGFEAPPEVEPPMREAFTRAAARAGAVFVAPPDSFRTLYRAVGMIQDYEGARSHAESYFRHGRRVGAKMADLVERGLSASEETYLAAKAQLARARSEMDEVFRQFDLVLWPAALGAAPEGFATTGDPRMNAPFTGLGTPAISIPMPVEIGLPLGLQIVAARHSDSFLLAAAAALEGV